MDIEVVVGDGKGVSFIENVVYVEVYIGVREQVWDIRNSCIVGSALLERIFLEEFFIVAHILEGGVHAYRQPVRIIVPCLHARADGFYFAVVYADARLPASGLIFR